MWRCHQLLSGFLAKGHLPRVSRQSRLSVNDKCDNEMIQEAVHRSLGICLTAEENPIKLSDEGAVQPVITSNRVPFLQMRSVGSHSTSGKEKEEGRKGWCRGLSMDHFQMLIYCIIKYPQRIGDVYAYNDL